MGNAALPGFSISNFPIEPCLGELPVAHHGRARDTQHTSDFFARQSTEEAQLDDAATALVNFGQTLQSLIQRDEIRASFRAEPRRAIESDGQGSSAPLLSFTG